MAGSTSGTELKPTIPAIYGTNQTYWGILALLGLLIGLAGLILKRKK